MGPEKLTQYKSLIRRYLADWVSYHPSEKSGIPLTIVEDANQGHFLLLEVGTGNQGWVYQLYVHLQLTTDARVTLLKNNTLEDPLAELIERGVNQADCSIAELPVNNLELSTS